MLHLTSINPMVVKRITIFILNLCRPTSEQRPPPNSNSNLNICIKRNETYIRVSIRCVCVKSV